MHPLRFLLPDDRRGRGVPALFPQANTMKSPGFACRFVRDGGDPKNGPREFVPPGSFLYFHPEFGPFLQEFSGYRPLFWRFPEGGSFFPLVEKAENGGCGTVLLRFCVGRGRYPSGGDGRRREGVGGPAPLPPFRGRCIPASS